MSTLLVRILAAIVMGIDVLSIFCGDEFWVLSPDDPPLRTQPETDSP